MDTDYLLEFLAKQLVEVAVEQYDKPSDAFVALAEKLEEKIKEYRDHPESCDCDYCMR